MESLMLNPVTTAAVESMIVSEAAAILENANKRRRLDTPTTVSSLESSIVEVVLETPITMATSSFQQNGTCGSPKEKMNGVKDQSTGSPIQQQQQQQQQQPRFVPFDNSCKTEQIALLTALSQVVSCTQEAVKILRESQERSLDLEHKRFRFQLEAEEKRLMMESEHYRKMETMFSGLIQAISQAPTPTSTPATTTTTTSISEQPAPDQQTRTSPMTVKLEVDG